MDFYNSTSEGDKNLFLAVGTEGGNVSILELKVDVEGEGSVSVASTIKVRSELWLPKAVTQLAWRPVGESEGGEKTRELAIAGEDGSLRIYAFGV